MSFVDAMNASLLVSEASEPLHEANGMVSVPVHEVNGQLNMPVNQNIDIAVPKADDEGMSVDEAQGPGGE